MAKRGAAVHVATTRRTYKGKVYESHLLRRNYREDGKVKHETIANLSHLPAHLIEVIRRSLKGDIFVCSDDAFSIQRSLPHGNVAAVIGAMGRIKLGRVISSRSCRERDLVLAMIALRILSPGSKLSGARALASETCTSTLAEELGVVDATDDELYEAMDWLHEQQQRIEDTLAARHLCDGTLVLYDITSTYYTGARCPLAKLGHSRDGKKGTLQILFGLLCTKDGCPVAVEVFDGNVGDPATIASQVDKLRRRFGLTRVVLVGDRGMITSARIREDLRGVDGLDWITTLRAPAIQKLVRQGAVDRSLFDEVNLAEISSDDFPGERLIVCRNQLLADERTRKREELLQATEREFQKIVNACERRRRPLRGKENLGIRFGQVKDRYRMAKHFRIEIHEDRFEFQRDLAGIAEEQALDGLYVIRTSVDSSLMSANEAVRTYKRLSSVERAFRCLKTVDLKVRPIYHRLEQRVRAHVFLCTLAYYVEWHMRRDWASILFDDDDRDAAEAQRPDAVAKARRSEAALAKAATKRTADDLPVHSFQDLLAHLATLTRNEVSVAGAGIDQSPSFRQYASATAAQRRALTLLGVRL